MLYMKTTLLRKNPFLTQEIHAVSPYLTPLKITSKIDYLCTNPLQGITIRDNPNVRHCLTPEELVSLGRILKEHVSQ